jgi:hypothetical protein
MYTRAEPFTHTRALYEGQQLGLNHETWIDLELNIVFSKDSDIDSEKGRRH